jgi:putative restriction endonuclease
MNAFVGVTDGDWFDLLASEEHLDEVNFWQPSGNTQFRALIPGELFLFKLHSPNDFIVGGGLFAHSSLLPVSLAWDAFGVSNGAVSLSQMRSRIEHYRRRSSDALEDYTIGCVILAQPFFLPRESWIPIPGDWKPNIVRGRTYDLEEEPGRSLFHAVEVALSSTGSASMKPEHVRDGRPLPENRYGKPVLITPRVGQGGFKILVTDAYARRCTVTGERVLPVLEAAHIHPYSQGGQHNIDNGLLMRRDLHTLFDRGYVTITQDLQIEVSRRIREEFENGRDYYAFHGHRITTPRFSEHQPAGANLLWHNEHVFRG